MSFNNVSPGKDIPNDFNVIIEIPAQSDPVKYEADKETGMLHVDRFVGTGMRYPAKLVAVPVNKLSPATAHMTDLSDIGQNLLDQIKHFFEQYKALEAGKWVKVEGWGGIEEAHKEIVDGVANYKK